MRFIIKRCCSWFDNSSHKEIPLASDYLTTEEIAQMIGKVANKPIKVVYKTPEEIANDDEFEAQLRAVFTMLPEGFRITDSLAGGLVWDNLDGYTADVSQSNQYGVVLMNFAEWCPYHQGDFQSLIK